MDRTPPFLEGGERRNSRLHTRPHRQACDHLIKLRSRSGFDDKRQRDCAALRSASDDLPLLLQLAATHQRGQDVVLKERQPFRLRPPASRTPPQSIANQTLHPKLASFLQPAPNHNPLAPGLWRMAPATKR